MWALVINNPSLLPLSPCQKTQAFLSSKSDRWTSISSWTWSLVTVGNRKSIAIRKGEKAIIISLQVSSICEGWKGRGIQLFPFSLMKDVAFIQPLEERLKIRQRKMGWVFLVGDTFYKWTLLWEQGKMAMNIIFSSLDLSELWGQRIKRTVMVFHYPWFSFLLSFSSAAELENISHPVQSLPLDVGLICPAMVKYALYWSTKLLVVLAIQAFSHTYGMGFEQTPIYKTSAYGLHWLTWIIPWGLLRRGVENCWIP